jgi:signal peptidase
MEEAILRALSIDIKKEALRRGRILTMPAIGMSMFPFIRSNDTLFFRHCSPIELRCGDILLYHSSTADQILIAHRLVRRRKTVKGYAFVTKGDFQSGHGSCVAFESIIGKVVAIKKPGFTLSLDGLTGRVINTFMFLISVTGLCVITVRVLGKIRSFLKKGPYLLGRVSHAADRDNG